MSALKPCPLCGGEAAESTQGRFAMCPRRACQMSAGWTLLDIWQSLPRPKKAPRCPECGASDGEMDVEFVHGKAWCECNHCGHESAVADSIDAALDQWRPE